jgi:hypothetical protein
MPQSPKAPAVAGVAYLIAWIAGLAVWPSNLSVTSTSHAVVTAYGAHRVAATVQFVLVEGVAALALGIVVMALASRTAQTAGLMACGISLVQCVVGVVLVTAVASPDRHAATEQLFDVINRLDGVKMLTLGTMIATISVAWWPIGLPRWLAAEGVLAVAALGASGAGYLTGDGSWANAAAASLPLLLLWVLGTGITLRRTGESALRLSPRPAA